MPFPAAGFYRFFLVSTPHFWHGPPYYSWMALEALPNFPGLRSSGRTGGLGMAALGRHLWFAPRHTAGVLLRLRRIARARWMHEDVRAEEVRFAMVGYQLRQAPGASSRQ